MSNPDRERRLAEISAREQAATKGPWAVDAPYTHAALDLFVPDGRRQPTIATVSTSGKDLRQCAADFDFMAEAREDVPWLLSEARDSVPTEDVVGIIYSTLNAAMGSGDEGAVKACLRQLVGLPLTVMLAGMSISLPWASKLREERTALVDAIRAADPERADALLLGLVHKHIVANQAIMDASDGPICGCGETSTHESGWCGTCGEGRR